MIDRISLWKIAKFGKISRCWKRSPGDLLVHHALTIHRADRNRSQTRTRQALGFIYDSERAQVDEKAHAAYQKQLAAEMKEEGKI